MLESLDPSILLGFVEEAQSYTPTIREGIIAFRNDVSRRDEIQLAYRQIHTVKGAALMIGLYDLAELAGEIENVLEPLTGDDGATLETQTSLVLLTRLDQIEVTLDEKAQELRSILNSEEGTKNWEDETESSILSEYPQFNSQDFQNASVSNGSQSSSIFTSDAVEDEDEEIDPEMLEVFTLEAEEHLQNIAANLQVIEQNPHHGEALQSIRRSAHTLKGAAGVVGFKTTSRLAHRMEDLLDRLAEQPLDSTPQTTALLLSATDLLEALARGASKQSLRTELNGIYSRFDAMLPGSAVMDDSASHSLSEFAALQATAFEQKTASSENAVASMWNGSDEQFENNMAAAATAAPRTVVRVGFDRLDEMVNLMGEMVISRTALEQRLKDIESQLGEMRLSTSRLRRIAGKLEVDYEISALAGSSGIGSGSGSLSASFLRVLKNNPAAGNPFALTSNPSLAPLESKHGFDDLEFDRYTEFHELTRQLVETSSDTSAITGDLDDLLGDLDGLLTRQRRLSDELQEKLMRLRMVALGSLSARLHRTVRVTADAEDKLVSLEIEGEEVEIDTQVLSSLTEPLLHLLRNSVVHGIEAPDARMIMEKPAHSAIKLRAFYEGTHIILSVADDGCGMNPKTLREKAVREHFITPEEAAAMNDEQAFSIIFQPGFSTAKQLTESAGRGVGMDIVRESVTRQQGTISIKSISGRGTTISIRLPMSMAVTRSLIVRALGRRYAIPLNMISQLAQVSITDFDQLTQEKILWVGGKFYPVYALNDLIGLPALAERDNERIPTLLIQVDETIVALTLDEVVEAREIVIKPFVNTLFKMRGLLGATILGDGSVVPILDLLPLIKPEEQKAAERRVETVIHDEIPPPALQTASAALTVMIVDDSPSVRRVMSNFITKSGLIVVVAKDGLEAVEILQQSRELPNIILSDVEMPRMDGYELLTTLKRQAAYSHIPVVMITSRAGEKHRQRALELGASEYVTKPYQDSTLLETIKQLTS